MANTIRLTPASIATEIPTSLLPASCGPISADSYRDDQVRPLVWLIFGGTGALGRQISKLAIGRRDKVMIAALDKEYDSEDSIFQEESEHEERMATECLDENLRRVKNETQPQPFKGFGYYGPLASDNMNKRSHPGSSDGANPRSRRKSSLSEDKKRKRPEPFLYVGTEFKNSCRRVECDVRIRTSVDETVQKCLNIYGRIDVVVTCFGYGVVGACEDQVDSEVRSQFEVNFMGLFHTLRAVIPYMTTAARSEPGSSKEKPTENGKSNSTGPISGTPGHIISFTSSMGVLGAPGFGPYSATRWAAEGLLESFAIEVEHLGCKVTIIETGYAKSGDIEDTMRVARPYVY